ncbi:short transient receptor potential channel 4-associated protein isoform X1 [Physeter macrocephalus]|uniref:Short transient receptor potential channel 4-associated protein isoform X1 n=2 Tax=Physeter macrocephalus TaxID=9755 RepID=A0A9W2X3C5_PHYMC|nr:short transient receptor potential channel 4-associated protein isoform X1 [Physeter catodon]
MAAAPAAAGSGVGRGRRAAATVAAWGGWGGRPRPGNILLQLRQGQLTGRGLVRAVQFTETFLTERDKQSKWSGIPQLLLKLYATSHLHSDFIECQNILKEISPLLSMEAMAFVTEERKLTQETTYPNTYIFDLFGGVDLLVEILMRPTISIRGQKLKISDEMSKDCLSILYNTCVCTEGVTKRLAEKNDFVIFLFTLMTSKKTFLQTATLIEDILGVKKEMIRLDEVPNLSSLVSNFDQQQLANFCRILAVTISEMDTGNDDKHTLLAKNAQQKKSLSLGPSAAEINQAALLSIPGFVERLCKLATRKVSESTGTASFLQELEEWYTWLDNALVLDALMRVANEESEHNQASIVLPPPGASEENGLPHTSPRTQLPQSMKIMHEIMYKLEVLYVLCVLLMGRQRNQVHRMIAEFKLIPGLNNLFDKLIWRKHSASALVLHGHNQNCDCSPDITLKIQFLRLLQSFSDHHENKYLLLNNQELNELSAISLKANIPEVEAVLNTDRSLVCDGKRGLLTRLLQVMKKEPAESSFRFWQARAVESFLRGTTSYADQMFLLKRGLLEHILYCIVDSECKSRDVLQSYFDLLGELMKFNVDAFKRFNKYINTDAKALAVSSREPTTPVSPASAPVPGVPEADQQLAGGLQHAGALRHSVTGPIRKPGGHESRRGPVRVPPACLHIPGAHTDVLPLPPHQYHPRADADPGECQLPEHQPGDPDAGPTERAAAPVPAAAAADGAQQEVPWLPAQQLPQPAALLAAALPTQGQGQHLPGEQLLHQLLILERDRVHPVEPGPPVTLCPCQLHRGALHGHRQGLHRGVILGQASGGCWAWASAGERGYVCLTPCPVPSRPPTPPPCCSPPAPGLQVQAWWEGATRSPWPLGLRAPGHWGASVPSRSP